MSGIFDGDVFGIAVVGVSDDISTLLEVALARVVRGGVVNICGCVA